MQLTEHFSLEEFEHSPTARMHGIDNRVPSAYIPAVRALCQHVLEPLRLQVKAPVTISSGYRCRKLNQLVHGKANSQHLHGEAADISLADKKKLKQWFVWLMNNTHFDQLIMERSTPRSNDWWIHVSYRLHATENRQEVIYGVVKYKEQ